VPLKVLLITYYWPPAGGGGVFRWLKMSRYFQENNIDLHIYTPSNPEFPAIDGGLVEEVSETLTIIKRPILEPYSLYKKFTGKKKDEKIYSGFINEKKSLAQNLSIWIRGNFFIPDARKFWIKPSIKFLNNLQSSEKFDAVISTGPPHSMHLIARGLKQKHPALKWIADFRDPWTNIDFYNQLKLTVRADRKHRKLEKSVLEEADKVVSVGYIMAKELKEITQNADVEVIPNGYDHLEFTEHAQLTSSFSIMHLGSMNRDRNPEVLWRSLADLKSQGLKPLVKIIGQTDVSVKASIQKYELKDQVVFEDFVPHKEAIMKMKSAHVLLLVVNNTPNAAGILTGKVFEYLGAQRPIIAIGPEEGDVKKLLKDFVHAFYISYDDVEECKKVISEVMTSKIEVSPNGILKYSRKALAEKYSKLLKEVCS